MLKLFMLSNNFARNIKSFGFDNSSSPHARNPKNIFFSMRQSNNG